MFTRNPETLTYIDRHTSPRPLLHLLAIWPNNCHYEYSYLRNEGSLVAVHYYTWSSSTERRICHNVSK
ncbi:unnamed protein product [Parnassius mnemosyne]|uniref:Uncharacterized protein n=1 Tax=Parnassius mnemosyne TaxID=213953 RepID=A0AAV1M7M6_9NEOP